MISAFPGRFIAKRYSRRDCGETGVCMASHDDVDGCTTYHCVTRHEVCTKQNESRSISIDPNQEKLGLYQAGILATETS